VPTTKRSRILAAPQQVLWELIADPHHLPRWWPGVTRMENVEPDRWTQVFKTSKGRPVRADFHLLQSEPPSRLLWEQELQGTPFERVLNALTLEIHLAPAADGKTSVTIVQEQKLRGYSRTGGFLMRGAARRQLDDALEGLERVAG
jgi:uncharacterized protein YndB with AHSA1/START domain